jgi:hypothetical protein
MPFEAVRVDANCCPAGRSEPSEAFARGLVEGASPACEWPLSNVGAWGPYHLEFGNQGEREERPAIRTSNIVGSPVNNQGRVSRLAPVNHSAGFRERRLSPLAALPDCNVLDGFYFPGYAFPSLASIVSAITSGR